MLKEIKHRLQEFKSLPESEYKKEFLFCLLTPQSRAQSCWQAVEELSRLNSSNKRNISKILSKKTRFHNTKTERILNAYEIWPEILQKIKGWTASAPCLRNCLAETINGFGLKEASHFLRNIGKSNNEIAILDRHILRNLHKLSLIEEPKIKSQKHYLKIEQIFLNYAKQIGIQGDELDLLWWSQENGEIFK